MFQTNLLAKIIEDSSVVCKHKLIGDKYTRMHNGKKKASLGLVNFRVVERFFVRESENNIFTKKASSIYSCSLKLPSLVRMFVDKIVDFITFELQTAGTCSA